jgi:hypothetical protein
MLKQRRLAAEEVAVALFGAEDAIDAALMQAAHLSGIMPAMRKRAGASALVGQDALERVAEAFAALSDARRAMVEAHKALSVAQSDLGLGAVTLGGDAGEKPPPQGIEVTRTPRRRLQAVPT